MGDGVVNTADRPPVSTYSPAPQVHTLTALEGEWISQAEAARRPVAVDGYDPVDGGCTTSGGSAVA